MAVFAIMCMVYFNNFIEAVLLGLVSDLIYGIPETRFYGFQLISFTIFLVVFVISMIFKKKILMGGNYKKLRHD